MSLLKEYKNFKDEQRFMVGNKWNENNKIFTSEFGIPLFPTRPSIWFHNFLKRHNLPQITFHQLRHTNASLLLAQGVDIATVSKRLGHAKNSITLDIYSHAMKAKDKEAADKLNNLFVKPKDIT